MAGGPVLGNLSCQRYLEISRISTSNCTAPRSSWRASSLSASASLNKAASGIQRPHGASLSLNLGSALFPCRPRHSRAQKTNGNTRRSSQIVSEQIDDGEPAGSGVSAFLSSLQPSEEGKSLSGEKGFWTWNPVVLLDRIADHVDVQTELGTKKRRAFYRAEDWVTHRSSKRHFRHIASTFSSRVIISLIPPVTALTSIAAAIAAYNTLVDGHFLPSFFPLLHTSSLPYQLTAPALALLLVFRTEASYSRYDEARKTWTRVYACTKDFSRQCLAWVQQAHDSRRRTDLQHYIMAFPVALKCHLLDEVDLYEDLKLLLDKEDLDLVMKTQHRPNCLIQLMTQSLGMVNISENQRNLMDSNITQFNESVSVCERIVRTPIPLSYTRLTSRALVLWHITLPLVLWDECKWTVIFATFFSACTLFCIEEVGVLIEEPFPMLALDKMCAVAHENVQELVELQTVTDTYLKAKEKQCKTSTVSGAGTFERVPSNGLPPSPSK